MERAQCGIAGFGEIGGAGKSDRSGELTFAERIASDGKDAFDARKLAASLSATRLRLPDQADVLVPINHCFDGTRHDERRFRVRVLIIEDDIGIASNLYDYLSARGHEAVSASDGMAGYRLAISHDFDALVLDIRLPKLSGLDLCRRLRTETEIDTPVLMLTALDTIDDKLNGFLAGADDYLVKPYSLREVEARLLALAKRRKGQVVQRKLQVGDLTYDPDLMIVMRAGEAVKLPPKCIRILAAMMQTPNRVFRRTELEAIVWGGQLATSETLRAHMHLLRRALARKGLPNLVETVHGVGYRLAGIDTAQNS
jgi:DNA-binding response OmpR family regulator